MKEMYSDLSPSLCLRSVQSVFRVLCNVKTKSEGIYLWAWDPQQIRYIAELVKQQHDRSPSYTCQCHTMRRVMAVSMNVLKKYSASMASHGWFLSLFKYPLAWTKFFMPDIIHGCTCMVIWLIYGGTQSYT